MLELRPLRTLLALEIERGMEGVGTARRVDCEGVNSGGSIPECSGYVKGAVCGRWCESVAELLEFRV